MLILFGHLPCSLYCSGFYLDGVFIFLNLMVSGKSFFNCKKRYHMDTSAFAEFDVTFDCFDLLVKLWRHVSFAIS